MYERSGGDEENAETNKEIRKGEGRERSKVLLQFILATYLIKKETPKEKETGTLHSPKKLSCDRDRFGRITRYCRFLMSFGLSFVSVYFMGGYQVSQIQTCGIIQVFLLVYHKAVIYQMMRKEGGQLRPTGFGKWKTECATHTQRKCTHTLIRSR